MFQLTGIVCFLSAGATQATVLFADNGLDASTGNYTARVSFDPLSFTTTASNPGNVYVLFENFFEGNSTVNTSIVSGSFLVGENGNAPQSITVLTTPFGQITSTISLLDSNDLIVGFDAEMVPFGTGDSFTLEGVDLTYSSGSSNGILAVTSGENIQATLVNGSFDSISDSVLVEVSSVPEPTVSLLLGLGGLMLTFRGRRRS